MTCCYIPEMVQGRIVRMTTSARQKGCGAGRSRQSQKPAPPLMVSIPPKMLCKIAEAAAFESGRPWRVEDLLIKAQDAYDDTAEPPSERLGLSRKRVYGQMIRGIYEQVKAAGERMDPLPPGQSEPTPEQIETALGAFTVKQWTSIEASPAIEGWPIIEYRYGLMESVGLVEVETFLSYLRQNASELKQRFGARKVKAIEGCAIMRHTELTLPEDRDRMVAVSDVYWAGFWPELARTANLEGKGHTATGRSIAELNSNRSIARRLTKRDAQTDRVMEVSRDEVKKWRERMERLPFEQYAADVGAVDKQKRNAAFIAWLSMIRKKHQRKT